MTYEATRGAHPAGGVLAGQLGDLSGVALASDSRCDLV